MDGTDLQIIRFLARDSRTPYKSIAADVGITQGAAKERIKKMLSNGVIQKFVVLINPIIFGYEKLCVLIVKNIDKTTKEQDIFKKLSLLGDLVAYSEQLEGSYIFRLYVKDITQYKIETVTDLLKPATVKAFFADFSPPPTMKIHSSDSQNSHHLQQNRVFEVLFYESLMYEYHMDYSLFDLSRSYQHQNS